MIVDRRECYRLPCAGMGRLTFPQKVAHARSRLVSSSEAIEKIRARHGATSLERLPAHIEPFADYMVTASKRPVKPRDMVKAYAITRSSVRRKERKAAVICETFPGYAELRSQAHARGEKVRPEDAMSILLAQPDGRAYLDAAERGEFDATSARRIVASMGCFGLGPSLMRDMKAGVALGQDRTVARALREASPEDWIALVDSPAVPGIGPAKAGFFAALLGRGDVPTFDAREIDLWRRKPKGRTPNRADVHALRERLATFPLALEARHEPARQHLAHHALWDAFPGARDAPTQTTHQEVIDAMRFAGLGGEDENDFDARIGRARAALDYEEPKGVAQRLVEDGASVEQAYLIVRAAQLLDAPQRATRAAETKGRAARQALRDAMAEDAEWERNRDKGTRGLAGAGLGAGLGWLWPLQDCGKPYDKFRAGFTFKDAYDWLAYRKNEQGQSFRPSQRRIVGAMAHLKREAFEQYQQGCAQQDAGGPPAKTWASCDRVCKVKSQPCGRACISKKRKCKKLPPDVRSCSIEEFQTSLPFESIAAREADDARRAAEAAEDWEDRRAIYGSGRDEAEAEADTSFDFSGLRGRGRGWGRPIR